MSTADPTALDHPAADALIARWAALWNGDLSVADEIMAPDNRVHAALFDGGDGSAVGGIEGMKGLVGQLRALLPDLSFTVEVGPVVDGDHVVIRWVASGGYAGGMPGAAAPSGTPVTFHGADFLRVVDGRVAEYWFDADSLDLLTQLRVTGG